MTHRHARLNSAVRKCFLCCYKTIT